MFNKNSTTDNKGYGEENDTISSEKSTEDIVRQVAQSEIKEYIDSDEFQKKEDEILDRTNRMAEDLIKKNQIKSIETLGVFVALFTFVSVELQVFKSATGVKEASGITLILLGALSFFLLIMDIILSDNKIRTYRTWKDFFYTFKKPNLRKILPIISFLLIFLGIILVS